MLVIMTPGTEVFPVAAVRRIIIVITVAVVNGEKVEVGQVELLGTLGADPSVELQRALPVILGSRLISL
jgi:hypothetical protein